MTHTAIPADIHSSDSNRHSEVRSFRSSDAAVVVSRGASYLALQSVITSIAMAISFAVLARIITPKQMGILAVLSLITALSQAIDGSAFQQSASKFIGELSFSQREIASSIFYQTFRISLIVSIPLAAFIFLEAPALASMLLGAPEYTKLFMVLALDVLVYAGALPVGIGTLFGMQRFKTAATIGIAGTILRQFLIIVLILFMRDFVGLVIAWVLSDYATFAVYAMYIFRVIGRPKIFFSARKLLNFSWPLSVGSVISFGYGWFDRALLIGFVPLASLGIYNAAMIAFGVLTGILGSLSNALLPAYSEIVSRDPLESCRNATRLTSRYGSFIIVPLAFGLLATARPALTLFVGQAYAEGTGPLMILSCVFALIAFGTGSSSMILALAETRLASGITVVSVGVGLASAYLLLPIWSIVGASVARGLALVTSTALTVAVLDRKKAISLDMEAIWKSLMAGALMVAVLVLIQSLFYNRFLLPGYVFAGAIVYLVMLRLLKALRAEDFDLIERYLGPRLGFVGRILRAVAVWPANTHG